MGSPGLAGEGYEERLQRVALGAPSRPRNGRIVLAEPDTEWPAQFERLAARVRKALGSRVRLLEHVGSTSVPGLPAKPIIDMLLEVDDSAAEDDYVPALERTGWKLAVREPEWFEHRLLRPPDGSANMHVFSAGCSETLRMLRFRDWLRSHPEDRDRYAAVKKDLATRQWTYVQEYADAKSDVVAEIMGRAEEA